MAEQRKVGAVTYREAGADYFDKRKLRRHAGVWSLWALGVAAVISGDFSGWNLGLDAGGFGGLGVRLQGRRSLGRQAEEAVDLFLAQALFHVRSFAAPASTSPSSIT